MMWARRISSNRNSFVPKSTSGRVHPNQIRTQRGNQPAQYGGRQYLNRGYAPLYFLSQQRAIYSPSHQLKQIAQLFKQEAAHLRQRRVYSTEVTPQENEMSPQEAEGMQLFGQGKYEEALVKWKEAASAKPEDVRLNTLVGVALQHLRRFPESLEVFNKILQTDPTFSDVHVYRLVSVQSLFYDIARRLKQLAQEPQQTPQLKREQDSLKGQIDQLQKQLVDYSAALIELEPNEADHWRSRGFLRRDVIGDMQGAEADFKKALELEPESDIAWEGLALIHSHKGNMDESKKCYDNALKYYNSHTQTAPGMTPADSGVPAPQGRLAELYFLRGEVQAVKGDQQAAISDFTKATSLNPEHPFAYGQKARLIMGNPSQYSAILIDPLSPESQKEFQRLREVLQLFRTHIDNNPNDQKAFTEVGVVFSLMDDVKSAVNHFTKAIELKPSDFIALMNRAFCYERMNKPEEAVLDYQKALEYAPDDQAKAKILTNRAAAYKTINKLQEALDSINQALQIHPTSWAYNARAQILNDMNQPEKALVDINRFIEEDPKAIGGYINRGLIHINRKALSEAHADFTKALEMNAPASVAMLQNIYELQASILESMGGQEKQVLEYLNKAIVRDEKNPTLYAARGTAKQKMNDFEGAVEDFTMALKYKHETPGEILLSRAFSFANCYQIPAALKDLDTVLEYSPNNELAKQMKKEIEERLSGIEFVKTSDEEQSDAQQLAQQQQQNNEKK